MTNTMRELFSPPFYPGIIGIGWTIFLLFLVTLSKRRKKKAEETKPKDPDVKFLEEALDEDAPRKPNPNYSYAEFQRDVYDKGLTFEEIYEKCSGIFPKKPKEPETKAEPKNDEGPGSKSEDPDRFAQLQEWFQKQGAEKGLRKLVPPPPNPYPVIHKIYIRGRR